MAERRGFARKKRRFLVEFHLQGSNCTGFTYDMSPTGIFVRSHRVPAELARIVPSGFSMSLSDTPEDYFQFFASL